jgi:hypothetical protein
LGFPQTRQTEWLRKKSEKMPASTSFLLRSPISWLYYVFYKSI